MPVLLVQHSYRTPPKTGTQVKLIPNRVSRARFGIGLQFFRLSVLPYHGWGARLDYHQVRLRLRRGGGESWGNSGGEKVLDTVPYSNCIIGYRYVVSWVFSKSTGSLIPVGRWIRWGFLWGFRDDNNN